MEQAAALSLHSSQVPRSVQTIAHEPLQQAETLNASKQGMLASAHEKESMRLHTDKTKVDVCLAYM